MDSAAYFVMKQKFFEKTKKLLLATKRKKKCILLVLFLKIICSVSFYYRPFNLLSPSVTEDKSKTVRYFKLWSALHLKFELQLRIIGLRPTIVAIPRPVTKFSSARAIWILPNSKIGQNLVQGKGALQKPQCLWTIPKAMHSHSQRAEHSAKPLSHANACFTCAALKSSPLRE